MRNVIYPFIVGLLFGIISFGLLEIIGWNVPYLRQKFYGNPSEIPTLIFGYHIHHSVLGIISIGWGIYSSFSKSRKQYFWIGLGFGIILTHTVADGKLVFIEKIK